MDKQALGVFGAREMDDVKQKSRKHLDEAIALIPLEKKGDYLEALERAPELIEKESNPDIFLQFESFNSWVSNRCAR